ncbi:hypothetical protein HJFPF1_04207 [Paramyrothecium foliicola]|nr:hypothetical protein HJFPF1_04207 [Paramyrothecium foliicola]
MAAQVRLSTASTPLSRLPDDGGSILPISESNASVLEPSNSEQQNKPQCLVAVEAVSQKRKDGLASPQLSSHIFQHWKVEIIAFIIAIGLVIAIFLILQSFHLHVVPEWPHGITLGALLSVLANVLQAAVITAFSQIISQSKWVWFTSHYRPLQDLQTFTDGSRGGLGSARLLVLLIKNGKILPAVAVLLMLISLAIGPFVQQAIGTKPCSVSVPNINASLPYAHYVPRHAGWTRPTMAGPAWDADTDTRVAVYTVLTDPTSVAHQNITANSCTTGNCTFVGGDPEGSTMPGSNESSGSTFTTIGLCSSCADTTALLTARDGGNGQFFYSLPNKLEVYYARQGTWLNMTTDADLNWAGTSIPIGMARDSRWAFANVTVLTTSTVGCEEPEMHRAWAPERRGCRGPGETPNEIVDSTIGVTAVTCTLFPCMRTYSVSVERNNVTEALLSSDAVVPDISGLASRPMDAGSIEELNARDNSGFDYAGVHSPCRVGNSVYTHENLSSAPNTTELTLYKALPPSSSHNMSMPRMPSQNVSAPENCIYRHSAGWGVALTRLLNGVMFKGQCAESRSLPSMLECASSTQSQAATLDTGSGKFMNTVYADGNATASSITKLFQAFASGMTTKYRSEFGASERLSGSFGPDDWLPRGEVLGIVMQTTICTASNWQWLLLPAFIVAALSIVLSIVITLGWRYRDTQPIWKDSILPIVLHREQFEDAAGAKLDTVDLSSTLAAMDNGQGFDEIEEFSSKRQVQFVWPPSEQRVERREEISTSISPEQVK